jgi:hypothetical protein
VSDDRFNKHFDLEPTEYRKSDAKEPFWGFNAIPTIGAFLAALATAPFVTWLVTGQFPYWVKPFLE